MKQVRGLCKVHSLVEVLIVNMAHRMAVKEL